MSYKTKIALVIAIFLWASAFVGIRAGLHDYSPESLALLRYIIASICMGIIYFNLPQRNGIRIRDIAGLFFIGAVGIGLYNVTLNHGELVISSGMASFVTSQSPIITAIFAMLFLNERLTFVGFFGFIVSLCGVILIAYSEIGGFKWNPSLGYILLATLASSCYSVLQKPFLKKYHAIEATTYVIWGGTLFLMFYFPQLQKDLLNASIKSTVTVIYLGIFPAAMGYLAWSYVLTEIPTTRAGSFLYFMPFAATLLGWLLLGEVPMVLSILGGILAVVGVWLVNHSYSPLSTPSLKSPPLN